MKVCQHLLFLQFKLKPVFHLLLHHALPKVHLICSPSVERHLSSLTVKTYI